MQHALAQRVRDVCLDAHAHTFSGLHTVDVQTVNAVEADLRQLAAALDGATGRAPAEAVVRIRLLVSSPASPLLTPHDDPDSRRHAIEHAERLIDRCRADLAA